MERFAAATTVTPGGIHLPPGAGSSSLDVASAGIELLQARLGVGASLFTALRFKHKETAAHSMRVTLAAAAWALQLQLSDEERDIIEISALMHDIGKICVPDQILLKPGPLTADEARIMCDHRLRGVEILQGSCQSRPVLETVACTPAWFDGSHWRLGLAGHDIPLAARMLAIVDAFDAMTNRQLYRPASTREQAIEELQRYAGRQFDPELVRAFMAFQSHAQDQLHLEVARRWLERSSAADEVWRPGAAGERRGASRESVFREKLIENMRDAVIFVDADLNFMFLNPGAERITGLELEALRGTPFVPSMLNLRDEHGLTILDDESPVAEILVSGEQRLKRFMLTGRNDRDVTVDAHLAPVSGADGNVVGVAMLLHDVSSELSLEARCQNLHEMATRDPLTNVANRAEFNRVHQMFVVAHLERRLPCSLIICDIDHFKSVNDTYGHQAGDIVLQAFAKVLKGACRTGDLVARYGGEEFVMLCADTNNAVAASRADAIRRQVAQLPQPCLGGRSVTASFGVTEIQPGDTPESMLSRADRALYDAKENGRNRVVQLGTGLGGDDGSSGAGSSIGSAASIATQDLLTMAPLSLTVEKLRGFVNDHQAEVASVDQGATQLKIGRAGFFRRQSDREVPLLIDLRFKEQPPQETEDGARTPICTHIRVEVSLQRQRDRRRADAAERARQVIASIRSYLMAVDDPAPPPELALQKAKGSILTNWLGRK